VNISSLERIFQQSSKVLLLSLFLLISDSAFAHSHSHHPYSSGWKTYGNVGTYAIPIFAALLAIGKHDYEGLKELAFSWGTTAGATEALKRVTQERRPNGGCCASFPSGHASSAFSGASFAQQRYGLKYGIPLYTAATLVAISRVEVNAHHSYDVLAGALLAIGINYIFVKPYHAKGVELRVDPLMSPKAMGVGVELRY
jgi:membrane-associated phospholipid phosphatase